MKAKAEGIKAEDMAPVTLIENLGKVDPDRVAAWQGIGLRAIAAGEVREGGGGHGWARVGLWIRGRSLLCGRGTACGCGRV